jgi:hypothetical protein
VFPHPDISREFALGHVAELERSARRFRFLRSAQVRPPRTLRQSIELRLSECRDELERLAALSEKAVVDGDWLVADVDGIPVAALSLDDGTTLADPFKPTAQVVSLLKVRARQVAAA